MISLMRLRNEGVVRSNRDRRTLLDKMVLCSGRWPLRSLLLRRRRLLRQLQNHPRPTGAEHHLVTRAKSNAVAYHAARTPPPGTRKRGARKVWAEVTLRSLFTDPAAMQSAPSPVYGEHNVTLQFRSPTLLGDPWHPGPLRPRRHPTRASASSCLPTSHSIRSTSSGSTAGGFKSNSPSASRAHHWHLALPFLDARYEAAAVDDTATSNLHRESERYRTTSCASSMPITACSRGIVAQASCSTLLDFPPRLGLLRLVAATIRLRHPSVRNGRPLALRNTLPHFLLGGQVSSILAKFIATGSTPTDYEGLRLTA